MCTFLIHNLERQKKIIVDNIAGKYLKAAFNTLQKEQIKILTQKYYLFLKTHRILPGGVFEWYIIIMKYEQLFLVTVNEKRCNTRIIQVNSSGIMSYLS